MITKPTVLILGAGSNVEYRFPTGDVLRMDIINGLRSQQRIHKDLLGLGYAQGFLTDFREQFQQSSESIDRFLEQNPDYQKVGNEAIASILTNYERNADLYRTATPRWYDYLWRKLDEGHNDFADNKLSIITFNYDRSLEHYLAMALKRNYHLDDVRIGESLKRLEFIHLYGTIGGQPFIDQHAIPFGDISRLKDSAATITIIERSTDDTVSEAFEAAHKEISKAEYIFLLGFGFDWLNCERLAIADHMQKGYAKVYATAYRMGDSSMQDVRDLLRLGEGTCTLHSGDCLGLFDMIRSLPTH